METSLFTLDDKQLLFPYSNDKEKYVICTCAKNENPYIREWVEHYLNLKFDKIVIADNNDNSGELDSVLGDYIQEGKVQVFPCNGIINLQVPFYTQFCRYGNYKWCGYYDVDEFLEIPRFNDIKQFCDTIDDDIDVICFNWLMYGFDNKIFAEEGRVQDRFTRPLTPVLYQKENVFIKSLIRGNHPNREDSYFISAHTIKNNKRPLNYSVGGYYRADHMGENCFSLRYKGGYLKHYYTKSLEEWRAKTSRGWADGTPKLSQLNVLYYGNENNFPIQNFMIGPFSGKIEKSDMPIYEFNVILVTCSNGNMYSLFLNAMSFFNAKSGNTYLFYDKDMDDATFVILTEYAILTGNRAIVINDESEVWGLYLQYNHCPAKTYYIIDCF